MDYDVGLYDDLDYEFDLFNTENDFDEESQGFMDLAIQCLIPNLKEVIGHVLNLLGCCISFRLVSQTGKPYNHRTITPLLHTIMLVTCSLSAYS